MCREQHQEGAQRLMWRTMYLQLAAEATSLGIPASALPVVADEAAADEFQAAHKKLSDIMSSFTSAAL